MSQRALARSAGTDPGHLSRVERDLEGASLDLLVALAANLGADVSVRLFPTATAQRIRDHLQAPMVEALLRHVAEGWRTTAEVPVPDARGVIDVVLRNRSRSGSIACECHSQLRSVDLVLRRIHEKTLALGRIDGVATASSLLLLRATEATRRIVRLHEATFAATFPTRYDAALDALARGTAWPGSTLLWVRFDGDHAELMRRPPRGIQVGR